MVESVLLPTAQLVTPRRFDLAVKWRLFTHCLNANDPDAIRVYRWHIETRRAVNARIGLGTDSNKADIDAYLGHAHQLLVSMKANGFVPRFAVPIDPNGELLGGAHRVACALALGLAEISVKHEIRHVWAPKWDRQWFIDNGMSSQDLARTEHDWCGLHT